MIVGELERPALRARLQGDGLRLRTGSVVSNVRSRLPAVLDGIALHYAEHPVENADGFADFHVSVDRPSGPRRWFQPQVVFSFDGYSPFTPLPGDQGFPMLEWGLNWCVHNHCHQHLILHAAVLERGGYAVILPAPPGSGKSTLCAGLAFRGWRLLSDELTVIELRERRVLPLPRPISLKNASIDVLRRFEPSAVIGREVRETLKGTVAHVKPPVDAVRRASETARPRWIVLPRFEPGAGPVLEPLPKGQAVMQLVHNAFNYHLHRRAGFEALAALVDGCECYTYRYSQLDDAVVTFDELHTGAAPR